MVSTMMMAVFVFNAPYDSFGLRNVLIYPALIGAALFVLGIAFILYSSLRHDSSERLT